MLADYFLWSLQINLTLIPATVTSVASSSPSLLSWLCFDAHHPGMYSIPVQHHCLASGQPSLSCGRNSQNVIAWIDQEKPVTCSGRSNAFVYQSVSPPHLIPAAFCWEAGSSIQTRSKAFSKQICRWMGILFWE